MIFDTYNMPLWLNETQETCYYATTAFLWIVMSKWECTRKKNMVICCWIFLPPAQTNFYLSEAAQKK